MERTIAIGSRLGMHARTAKILIDAVKSTGVPVKLARPGGKEANAGSLLSVMGLGLKCGDEVTVSSDDAGAVDKIADLLATDLDA